MCIFVCVTNLMKVVGHVIEKSPVTGGLIITAVEEVETYISGSVSSVCLSVG